MACISINGFAGVGKLTVGKALVRQLGNAHLIDNHLYMDPAFALFKVGSPQWRDLVDDLRDTVFDAAVNVAPEASLVFTSVMYDCDGDLYRQVARIAERRAVPFLAVTLTCGRDEHRRRLTRRRTLHKLTSWRSMEKLLEIFTLYRPEPGEHHHLDIDTTGLTAVEVASQIAQVAATLGLISSNDDMR